MTTKTCYVRCFLVLLVVLEEVGHFEKVGETEIEQEVSVDEKSRDTANLKSQPEWLRDQPAVFCCDLATFIRH